MSLILIFYQKIIEEIEKKYGSGHEMIIYKTFSNLFFKYSFGNDSIGGAKGSKIELFWRRFDKNDRSLSFEIVGSSPVSFTTESSEMVTLFFALNSVMLEYLRLLAGHLIVVISKF